ncbi:phospholipase D-like domain-containing protein [Leptolyngbya sp. FACHB-261]|uniref:phospholipase D-like domain-containing protein n=1 Tax=Leptolyngbya sp. FACHB-261 TaxID=2692806 RepID=UPI00168585D4|nr:phospholipase D-like domain-containing protein [Leptolyngbya sp. FACHB-261]MBD2100740.1 competence protein ComE [Leptolyngbya sp. FACHB-261]
MSFSKQWPSLLVGFLTLLALGACQQTRPKAKNTLPALPQEGQIQVYFNRSQATYYTEPYRPIERYGDNLEQTLIDNIATARTSIDVAIHELRLPGVAQALAERQRAGVPIRVVLENSYSRPWSGYTSAQIAGLEKRGQNSYREAQAMADLNHDGQVSASEWEQRDALNILRQAGVRWIDDTEDGSAGSSLMHHKFLVIDQRVVIVASANFTPSDVHGDQLQPESRGNANHLLRLESPELAAIYSQEFALIWGDGPGGQQDSRFGLKKPYRPAQAVQVGGVKVEVQFSPTSGTRPWQESVNGLIGRALQSAQRSAHLALFVFSDQNLANVLEVDHRQRGVAIEAVIDPGFAYRSYSEALDLWGLSLPQDCRLEAGNQPWQTSVQTVGVPVLSPGDLLHHKFGVVDAQTVITGSQNWSEAANQSNDENLLVIHSPIIAAHFEREFSRLYDSAVLGPTKRLRQQIQKQQSRCASVQQLKVSKPDEPS